MGHDDKHGINAVGPAPAAQFSTKRAQRLDYGVTGKDISEAEVQYGELPKWWLENRKAQARDRLRPVVSEGVRVCKNCRIQFAPSYVAQVRCNGCLADRSKRRNNAKQARKSRKAKRNNIGKGKRERIYARDGWACLKCGNDTVGYLSLDHIVPIADGGSNSDDNLQTLCKTCNCAKGRKTTAYYRASAG